MTPTDFTATIWEKGHELYRDMPWRDDTRPYYVLVSELMLQQTQVDRVIPKFQAFIAAFPDEQALAHANLAEVLQLWQGLGYNRRAKYLHDAAQMIVTQYDGVFPREKSTLLTLPGVGPNTAGAILNYAYNIAEPFIETNVRTVYFHHFFPDGDVVSDRDLLALVAQTIDTEQPRAFYWALMDYGSWLKRQGAGRLTQSSHYKKQSPLKGSVREVRGQLIRELTQGAQTYDALAQHYYDDERFPIALDGLIRDGLVIRDAGLVRVTGRES